MARHKSTARTRQFRDAPSWARCSASVRLRDGSYAQCGRWRNEDISRNPSGHTLCSQHGQMWFSGQPRHFIGSCVCWCATPEKHVPASAAREET